jgi:hypothetical protein
MALLVVCGGGLAWGQGGLIAARVVAGRQPVIEALHADGEARLLHQPSRPLQKITQLTLSPRLTRVAWLEWEGVPGGGRRTELVIADDAGAIIRRGVWNAQATAWVGERVLAVIVGHPVEGGIGFRPTGAFLLDVGTGDTTQLQGVGQPYRVQYAPFDSAVYLMSLTEGGVRVVRVPVGSRQGQVTSHLDLNFSPSGRYYLHTPDTRDPQTRVYQTTTDQEVDLKDVFSIGTPVDWAFDTGHALLLGPRRAQQPSPGGPVVPPPEHRPRPARDRPGHLTLTVFDLGARAVMGRVAQRITAWTVARGTVLADSAGRQVLLRELRSR